MLDFVNHDQPVMFVALLIVLSVATLPCHGAAAENLLHNPTFEGELNEQGLPPGWVAEKDESIQITVRREDGSSGEPYLHVVSPGDSRLWMQSTPIPVRPGGTYTATFRVRAENDGEPLLYLNWHNALHKRHRAVHTGDERIGDTKGEWIERTLTFEAPEHTPTDRFVWGTHLTFGIYLANRHKGAFDLADVSIAVEGGDAPLRGQQRAMLNKTNATSEPVQLGTRRELFVDDFLIDTMTRSVERRLHHPVPREIVMELDKPWEGHASAYFTTVEHEGKIRIYYNAYPNYPGGGGQTTSVIESDDGIHFTRPNLGLFEHEGSTDNNMLWRHGASGHNFTPFKDTNPSASDDQRFKAIAYHPNGGGLSAYVSADGIHWEMLVEEKIIPREHPETGEVQGGFDSQNLAFWDAETEQYVCYFRAEDPRGRMRGISRSTSKDFINWTDPEPLQYTDDRMSHMYTNGIRPYFRAPHIYIGTPNRYVPRRTKVESHPQPGINDVVLMSSRDGKVFDRWEEGFIRPGTDWQVWTDRNHYPAWGMVQTSPEELSLYWVEHYRHPTLRLRRGTIRTDGFVSLHAEAEDAGEMLTRPFTFTGSRLEVNYATSAIGSVWLELCDERGRAIDGFSLHDHGALFGNDVAHTVTWNGESDLSDLVGRTVRLRVRLHDADLYSIRFAE